MDWIEENIEKIRISLQEKSLVKALVCYLCIGMLGVGALYWVTRNLCLAWTEVVAFRYDRAITFHSLGEGVWSWRGVGGKEKLILTFVNFLYNSCLYLYLLICFALVGKIFLEKKIKPAVSAITQGLHYINMGDCSHEITWRSQDEMGALCKEFEQMRKTMLKMKRDQWKQQEEQRKINAAFAHDIRTPLTVIQGYTEFLQKYVPRGKVTEEMLLEKLETMHQQEERLLRFSTTMTTIQKMEKWELSGSWQRVSQIMDQLGAVVQGISQNVDTKINLNTKIPEQNLLLDVNLLTEVFENLLNNALRYAVQMIQVEVALSGSDFTLFVKDDGPGFSDQALRSGVDTYFSEEQDSMEHFGIGLSVCKILCENHGGCLTLSNSIKQGAISAATLSVGVESM